MEWEAEEWGEGMDCREACVDFFERFAPLRGIVELD